ncbi:MAG: O-succinylbenzoic acid--CoA ligase [Crocinitomicaceae bacterium]|nr:O-succinylbenzoic acid--CoA ligase [Crocinitomicaceae bacterium]
MIKTDFKNIFKLSKNQLDNIDEDLHSFLYEWKNNSTFISTYTSGSTGNPKKIKIEKKHMIASGNATINYFNLKKENSFLICLPIKTIGGKMMLVRSILCEGTIFLTKPKRNPFFDLKEKINFCALTPMQLEYSLRENSNINLIDKLIIGGGSISNLLISKTQQLKTKCYHTFGMTETISHIAIKTLNNNDNNDDFICLDHVDISTNKKGNLIVKSKTLGIRSITSNDIVKITGNKSFKWIGRSDNIINSGGVKISPETLENTLSMTLDLNTFFTTSISDSKLGEKLILISNSKNNTSLILEAIKLIKNPILKPKSIYIVNDFEYTNSNKINRKLNKIKALKQKPVYQKQHD